MKLYTSVFVNWLINTTVLVIHVFMFCSGVRVLGLITRKHTGFIARKAYK